METSVFLFQNDRTSASSEAGFSLTESVVALGVFALAALPMLSLVTQNLEATAKLEARTLASFVAENEMVETRLQTVLTTSDTAGKVEMGGMTFIWERSVTDTQEPQLKQIVIRVRQEDSAQILASMVGFWNG